MAIFCAKTIIWLPWQQGSVWSKFHSRCSNARSWKPRAWCKIFCYISDISRVIANIAFKFTRFRYHSKKGRCGVNFNDTIKLHETETVWSKNLGHIYYTGWDIDNFVLKFTNIHYHGNKSCCRCGVNFNGTVNLCKPESPLFRLRIVHISITQTKIYLIFC